MNTQEEVLLPATRVCSKCLQEKERKFFSKCSKYSHKLQSQCKECKKKYYKIKYTTDPKWRQEKLEKSKLWAKQNTEKFNSTQRKRRKQKDIQYKAYTNKRRANLKKATPKWANKFYIEEIYRLALLRNKYTSFAWHVDHIVPINHPLVCGLHCENNLQIIPAKENLKKTNSFKID